MRMKKIAVVGCKHTTKDFIVGLERMGYKVDHVVTIDPVKGESQKVAGYFDLREMLDQRKIPYTLLNKYGMQDEDDKNKILSLGIDMILVIGWQRLIPDWFIQSLSVGAFGMHGSSRPLPWGRGRSSINWSLIQGKDRFYAHMFQYMPGVDDGPIVGVKVFDINPHDTCLTLHQKSMISMLQLCGEHLKGLLDGTAKLVPQPKDGASYYPKRAEDDGIIYWTDNTDDIYNLVRAVTRPFPGAFSFLDDDPGKKIFVWKAQPFDTKLLWKDFVPGEIVEVFFDGTFVVKTGDSSMVVLESEGHCFTERDIGRKLGHLGKAKKVWDGLPE